MNHQFTLIVEGPDLQDDANLEALFATGADGLLRVDLSESDMAAPYVAIYTGYVFGWLVAGGVSRLRVDGYVGDWWRDLPDRGR
jgi:hypothetical protein